MAIFKRCVDCGKVFAVSNKDTRENYYCPDCDKKWKTAMSLMKKSEKAGGKHNG